MKKKKLLLFENRVYSTKPEDSSDYIFGPDVLYYFMFMQDDRDIMEIVSPSDITKQNKPTQTEEIFLFDEILTDIRNSVHKKKDKVLRENKYNLSAIRKIIVDEKYPVFVEYVREFKRLTAKRKTQLMLGEHSIESGRLLLVYTIQSVKYEDAIPELREIILHDQDNRMVRAATWALRDMHSVKSWSCLGKLLLEKNLPYSIQWKLIDVSHEQGSILLLPGLRKCFEENYHYFPKDYMEVYSECTIQQNILKACKSIPSFKALEILEMGVGNPYSHVEKTAILSIEEWVDMMAHKVTNGGNIEYGLKIAEVIKRYDLEIFKESYHRLKKKVVLL